MKKASLQKGFSLIELMVAISIFAIVMLVGVGAVLAIINGNKKNQTLSVAMNNLNYAVENMTRLMKTGTGFSVDSACTRITFTTTEGYAATYSLDGDRLELNDDPVTAPEIEINDLCFELYGEEPAPADFYQPAVIIRIAGTAIGKQGLTSDFNLHTSVTQRSVDY